MKDQCLIVTIPVAANVEPDTPVELNACLEATFAEQEIEDFACPVCNAKTKVSDQKRFVTYPRNLTISLKRIVYDEWVPKKLTVKLVTDHEAPLDLARFGGGTCELKEGEQGFPQAEEPDEVEPEVDMNMVNQLIANGVPELAAKHAVFNAGDQGADGAIMWFY